MGAGSTSSALAAARILVHLDDARGVLGESDWRELCLQTIVHVTNADAGLLIGDDGSVRAACGMSDDHADAIARGLRCGRATSAGCAVLAVMSLESVAGRGGLLGLCSMGHADSCLDLDAMTVVATPLLSMVAVAATPVCEVA